MSCNIEIMSDLIEVIGSQEDNLNIYSHSVKSATLQMDFQKVCYETSNNIWK